VNAGNTGKAAGTEPTGGNETAGMTGEVMARTPTIRTSQQQGDDSESPGYGDPRPLEKENDTAPVKGHKGKTYADTVRDALNKDDSASSGVSSAPPPLAEGLKPEQFRADQQMKQVTPDVHVNAENLFDEMVSRIETMQTDSKSAMTIQLKPEFLGKVALEIAIDAAGLHVKINAEDSNVRSMINGQMNALIESLENKGISVAEVEVTYTGVNNGTFKDSGEGRAQPEQSRRSHHNREVDPVDGAAYYAALSFDALGYLLEEDVSSVEYRA
jgi:flagellar hook-length control protein FliK